MSDMCLRAQAAFHGTTNRTLRSIGGPNSDFEGAESYLDGVSVSLASEAVATTSSAALREENEGFDYYAVKNSRFTDSSESNIG